MVLLRAEDVQVPLAEREPARLPRHHLEHRRDRGRLQLDLALHDDVLDGERQHVAPVPLVVVVVVKVALADRRDAGKDVALLADGVLQVLQVLGRRRQLAQAQVVGVRRREPKAAVERRPHTGAGADARASVSALRLLLFGARIGGGGGGGKDLLVAADEHLREVVDRRQRRDLKVPLAVVPRAHEQRSDDHRELGHRGAELGVVLGDGEEVQDDLLERRLVRRRELRDDRAGERDAARALCGEGRLDRLVEELRRDERLGEAAQPPQEDAPQRVAVVAAVLHLHPVVDLLADDADLGRDRDRLAEDERGGLRLAGHDRPEGVVDDGGVLAPGLAHALEQVRERREEDLRGVDLVARLEERPDERAPLRLRVEAVDTEGDAGLRDDLEVHPLRRDVEALELDLAERELRVERVPRVAARRRLPARRLLRLGDAAREHEDVAEQEVVEQVPLPRRRLQEREVRVAGALPLRRRRLALVDVDLPRERRRALLERGRADDGEGARGDHAAVARRVLERLCAVHARAHRLEELVARVPRRELGEVRELPEDLRALEDAKVLDAAVVGLRRDALEEREDLLHALQRERELQAEGAAVRLEPLELVDDVAQPRGLAEALVEPRDRAVVREEVLGVLGDDDVEHPGREVQRRVLALLQRRADDVGVQLEQRRERRVDLVDVRPVQVGEQRAVVQHAEPERLDEVEQRADVLALGGDERLGVAERHVAFRHHPELLVVLLVQRVAQLAPPVDGGGVREREPLRLRGDARERLRHLDVDLHERAVEDLPRLGDPVELLLDQPLGVLLHAVPLALQVADFREVALLGDGGGELVLQRSKRGLCLREQLEALRVPAVPLDERLEQRLRLCVRLMKLARVPRGKLRQHVRGGLHAPAVLFLGVFPSARCGCCCCCNRNPLIRRVGKQQPVCRKHGAELGLLCVALFFYPQLIGYCLVHRLDEQRRRLELLVKRLVVVEELLERALALLSRHRCALSSRPERPKPERPRAEGPGTDLLVLLQ